MTDPDREARSGQAGAPSRITLLTRPGCHLCDEARDVVRRVGSDLRVTWDERSVDEDPQLRERFGEEIPVVLVDGEQHAYWRVDERRLRDRLAAPGRTGALSWLRRGRR